MADDAYSDGKLNIRPEVTADTRNQSDSFADNHLSLDGRNTFGAQDSQVGGVDASASFAPVTLNISPTIKGYGSISATLAKHVPLIAVLCGGALVLLAIRRWKR